MDMRVHHRLPLAEGVRRCLPLADALRRLEAAFRTIQATRMQGVPLLHAALRVEAVGFLPEAEGAVASGVLITPWFMSLVRLPLHDAAAAAMLAPGLGGVRAWGAYAFDFLGAFELAIGAYETSSLFSPMAEFEDQAAAVATARSVLDLLRHDAPPTQPARRGFLLGRPSGGARA
jgi:[NiFe] hydrogenase assembly HybE family chaperone